ncbi:MAG: molybdate ABC transporter substrate-binding protein [Alphaproteobacteria bacterium]|nr:molybdate ABC transporter substrate-binding protein [Alphaproteobacteria bacterium]
MAWLLATLALGLLLAACSRPAPVPATVAQHATPLTVFAAASLKESMDAAAETYRQRTGQAVQVSYAGSSALARQIEQRAPADVFLSADSDWMDWLQERGLIDRASRTDLLGNALVLVAAADSPLQPLALVPGTDLGPLLGADGRIALALTGSVPAGKYAKAAFESLGMWDSLAPRVAEAENVRAALLLVSRGEAPLGIVYQTDAAADAGVRIVGAFPDGSHPPIVYPVALLAASTNPDAALFLDYLGSAAARPLFEKQGFTVLK